MDNDQFDELIKTLEAFEAGKPKGYPGSFLGPISALREAKKEFAKVIADLDRWNTREKENAKRLVLAQQRIAEQERQRKISNDLRVAIEKWQTDNADAISQATISDDWSAVPPRPTRADFE